MGDHNQNETLTRRPTLLALLIGGLVLAGGIALIVVATGGMGHGKSGDERAAAMVKAQKASASASSAATNTPATSSAPSSSSAPPSSAAASPASVPSKATKTAKPAASVKPITYTVKRGDNLTVIARWFHMHGYGSLYDANKSVIGNDPNLIFAGQKITVSSRGMSVGH